MGKRILQQRAGRGTSVFGSPSHIKVAPARYPPPEKLGSLARGYVAEILHDPGRWTPLARIVAVEGLEFYTIAVEGVGVGQEILIGPEARPLPGNILPLKAVPEGSKICNIERRPGDGGKIARRAGSYAILMGRSGGKAVVQLPSGRVVELPEECRATIGVPAGAGRIEKPLLKAGASYYKYKATATKWPRVRGVAMNPVSHKFGGGSHQSESHPTTVSRNAPPGRKVGHVAARRTGLKKR